MSMAAQGSNSVMIRRCNMDNEIAYHRTMHIIAVSTARLWV